MTNYMLILGTLYFLYGICIGSFLNVCIFRIPRGIPMTFVRSICPHCRHKLSVLDLVPILSWFCLKGTCRYCGKPIRTRYPLVESLTGILYVLCFWVLGPTFYSAVLCLFGSCLIVAAGIDLDYTYVPDRIHLFILLLVFAAFVSGNSPSITSMCLGCLVPSGIMLVVSLITKGGIGGGDIKLMAASGLLLGAEKNLFAFFLAYLLAGLFYIIPLLKGKINGKDEIPMVPFFATSLILSALFGTEILSWYFLFFL